MDIRPRRWLFILLTSSFILSGMARAQYNYSLSYQTNTISVSGVTSNWVGNGTYVVGSNTFLNALIIQSGGGLSNGDGFIGYEVGGSNNAAIVTGTGSWTNTGNLFVGASGAGNRLIITNGGQVFNFDGVVGWFSSSSSNSVLVTGTGSVWNTYGIFVGHSGAGNQMTIRSGGAVVNVGNGEVGLDSSNNVVTVTDTGSVWNSSSTDLFVGDSGAGNRLIITNGGAVVNAGGWVGFFGNNNVVTVTGTGSVWSNLDSLYVGTVGAGNQMTISSGGAVFNGTGYVGYSPSVSNNVVTVTGSGSVWNNSSDLYVGSDGATNTLNIGTGGSVLASNAYVGFDPGADGNKINVTGGSLYVTKALDVRRGTLTFNGGTISVDSLVLNTGSSGVMVFNSGTVHANSTVVTNSQQFVVGDGTGAANFHLLGGVHSFNNGLRIRNNAVLSGCGTINGVVVVDAGGTVLADCTSLVFGQSVTNNGTMRAIDGSVLESYGTVVNNGLIQLISSGTTNFHGAYIDNGSVVNIEFRTTSIAREGTDIRVTWATAPGKSNFVERTAGIAGSFANNFTAITNIITTGTSTNYLDIGAATNSPAFYYRIRLVP